MSSTALAAPSLWRPLRQPLFRALWIASIVSNIGTWMQNVGGVWLMSSLTPSPLMTALMQAATSLPIFLVGLPAGALADILDRRRLLMVVQSGMGVAAALLALLAWGHYTTPLMLLTLTFALGVGDALNGPVWHASLPELCGRENLSATVTLSGLGYNIARVLGPTIGGVVVALSGPGAVFLLNAVSFLAVVVVVQRWKREVPPNTLPAETVWGAMRAGIRYVRFAPVLQAVLIRSTAFCFFASALWALLPIVARQTLHLEAWGYGMLVASMGAGSLVAAFASDWLNRSFSLDTRLMVAGTCFAMATLACALIHSPIFLCVVLLFGGFGWLVTMVGVNVATQISAPLWVQARALAVYRLVTQGAIALGSVLWGVVATQSSPERALELAGAGLVVGLFTVVRWPLKRLQDLDFEPSRHWELPEMKLEITPSAGPVMVTVEYQVSTANAAAFERAIRALKALRLRDGASRWELHRDIADPTRYLETFTAATWGEHVRHHSRVTRSDRAIEEKVYSLHSGTKPRVTHLIQVGPQA